MRKSKFIKALLVFGMSVVTATSMAGIAACGSDSGENGNGGGSQTTTHQHIWSNWTDNGDGTHSRACSAAGHEGSKTETADHGTANSENKCPDCGYQFATSGGGEKPNPPTPTLAKDYATLAAQDNVIMKEDFSETLEFGEFTGYGVKGIYTDKVSTIVDFGPIKAGSAIEGYVKTTPTVLGSDWNFFSLYCDNSAVVTVTANEEGVAFNYTVKGSTATAATTISSALTPYSIYFKIDLSTKKLTLCINGSTIFNEIETDITNVDGINLITSDNDERLQKIDELVICGVSQTEAEYKETVSAKLDKAVADLDKATNYTGENGAALDKALEDAKAAVAAASDYAGIKTAYSAGLDAINAVPNDLAVVKNNAKAELDAYKSEDDYSEDNWLLVQAEIAKGKEAIDAASDADGVDVALASAKSAIDMIPDMGPKETVVTILDNEGNNVGSFTMTAGGEVDADFIKGKVTASGVNILGVYSDAACTKELAKLTTEAKDRVATVYVKLEKITEFYFTFADNKATATGGYDVSKWSYSAETTDIECTLPDVEETFTTGVKLNNTNSDNLTIVLANDATVTFYFYCSSGNANVQSLKIDGGDAQLGTLIDGASEKVYSLTVFLLEGEHTIKRGSTKEIDIFYVVVSE